MSATPSKASSPLDLDILEDDHTPTFVVKIGVRAMGFELLFCNEAFRASGLRKIVQAADRAGVLFRSWTQAVGNFEPSYELAGVVWSAEVAGRHGTWKVVRASAPIPKNPPNDTRGTNTGAHATASPQRTNYSEAASESPPPAQVHKTDPTARLESMQTMLAMSDIGVFEYTPQGTLIHGNEAWYTLSSHPRELPAHTPFSFMDLVYPEDQDIVMSAWNTLVKGKPVTFEMRWKARPGSSDVAQWVLSSCLPVYDDGALFSIVGNTVDITAQKSQEWKLEQKFTRFAQLAPIAIYIYSQGSIQYANDQFFELTGRQPVESEGLDWRQIVAAEDIERMEAAWATVLQGGKTELQFRLKRTWVDQEGVRSNIWVQSSSHSELDADSNVVSVMGTLFDISQFKWAERVQRRILEETLESKRQQENFIDMTSHELRNPLSAVVQCADSVITTLTQLRHKTPEETLADLGPLNHELLSCIDALQTIVSCSLHQKRLIDDVLTLSKLDSNLILITPVRVQPAVIVSEALKMFDLECNQMQINLQFQEDETLKGLEWVMLDPLRVVQILINLLTNAIKFTKDRPVRKVTVTLGGSATCLPPVWHDATFTNYDSINSDFPDRPEWGHGDKAFIWLKVEDTGCGMTVDEQKMLFARFSQASPRTHITYGGSGLGLFISKSLAFLQGGSIGVDSTAGVGSTFAFFVGTRVAPAPKTTNVVRRAHSSTRPILTEEAAKKTRLNILVVEDNLINQKVLKMQLQKAGCNVHVAGNGQETLDFLKRSVYWRGDPGSPPEEHRQEPADLDIILMDIEMPIMDGLTCTRRIREYEEKGLLTAPTQPRHLSSSSISPISSFSGLAISEKRKNSIEGYASRIPILAVSANARGEQIEQAIASGMDDAIAKPFRIPELWPKIEGLVARC